MSDVKYEEWKDKPFCLKCKEKLEHSEYTKCPECLKVVFNNIANEE